MGVFNGVIKLLKSRRLIFLSTTWITLVACLIVGKGFPPLPQTIMAVASVFFTVASVYIYNDYVDVEMDRLNEVKSNRPLVQGDVSMGFARMFIVVTALLGLGLSYLINRVAFLCNLIYYVLLFAYSYPPIRIKKMYMLKEFTISISLFMYSMIGTAAVSGTITLQGLYLGLILIAFSFLSQPGLHDQFDLKEDTLYGVRTMASVLPWNTRFWMLVTSIAVPLIVNPLTYDMLGFNVFLPVATTILCVWALLSIFKLRKGYEETQARITRKNVWTFFFILQLFMILGAINLF